jgi:eukaryotic-like serine/threonine-protein kinase
MADTTTTPPGTPVGDGQVPRQFGRYDVVGLIGEGAMGRVYRGFDPLANRPVAIKTIKREHLSQETTDKYIRRFRREAQAAGILSHPHIVGIFDVGDDYFVMELLTGRTLHDLLAEEGRMDPTDVLQILAPIADALDHAHRNGIVHRDIKPANIMIQPDGRAKLMDFGVARLEDSAATATGQIIGSPYYMAPEQMSGDAPVTARADTYSLAVVTYEALTGQRPFHADSVPAIVYKVVNEIPPPPRRWNLELPAHYDTAFARALSKDPMARPATATEFMTSLVPKDLGKPIANLFRPVPDAAPPRAAVEDSADAGATWDIPPAEIAAKAKETAPQRAVARSLRRHARWAAAALVLGAVAVFAWPRALSPPPPAAPASGVRIDSEPSGAVIWVDGTESGTSPRLVAGVAAGHHKVRLSAPGFADAELGIVVPGDGKYPPLHFVLQPIAARVRIDSSPPGVAVSVDGEHTGMTPLDMVLLEPGRHEIRMDREGLRPWVKEVDAKIGESFAVQGRLLPVDTGSAAGMEPTQPGMLISLGLGVTPPRKISGEPASLPDEARARKLQGAVTVDMIITEEGNPIDVTVVESGGEVLNRALVEAVRGWRYEPARKDGVNVRVHWRVRQIFRLNPD